MLPRRFWRCVPNWFRLRLASATTPLVRPLRQARLVCLSLCYNSHLSWAYVMDTALEPLFWCVDNFTHLLGPAFVVTVVWLKLVVVAIAYIVGLPYYWQQSPNLAVLIVIFGQFFFVNVAFNFWMALTVDPGAPPIATTTTTSSNSSDGAVRQPAHLLPQVSSICKKCIAPKPPRTHHCSVCRRCVLKMDHHCPWLNNCVGHYNHRYFFLYMLYTVLGCGFLMCFGFQIVYKELFGGAAEPDMDIEFNRTVSAPALGSADDNDVVVTASAGDSAKSADVIVLFFFSRRSLVMMEAFITTSCFLILGGLMLWHARLITRGETSIEAHINQSEAKRHVEQKLGRPYRNPYDFSPWHNWCLFLGLIEGRGWSSVLWPSTHKPKGQGLTWDTVYSCDVRWNDQCQRIGAAEGQIKMA